MTAPLITKVVIPSSFKGGVMHAQRAYTAYLHQNSTAPSLMHISRVRQRRIQMSRFLKFFVYFMILSALLPSTAAATLISTYRI